jgi:hypothetical protein
MAYRAPPIEIPKIDIWSALFSRPSKPFPDSQGTPPSPSSYAEDHTNTPNSNLPERGHGQELHFLPPERHDGFFRSGAEGEMGMEEE